MQPCACLRRVELPPSHLAWLGRALQFHNYEAGEPCSVCGHGASVMEEAPPSASPFPTEVVPDFLYVGSYDQASRAELLRAMGIKRILNVRAAPRSPRRSSRLCPQTVPGCQNLYRNTFLYHTASEVPANSKTVPLAECLAFLGAFGWRSSLLRSTLAHAQPPCPSHSNADEAHAAQEKVLVHCMSGSSRCASHFCSPHLPLVTHVLSAAPRPSCSHI